jgi:hydrogenase maturation protein HypF
MRSPRQRLRIEVRGAVQGVGFRPFVYRLANECSLAGWVINGTRGVLIEVEGARRPLEDFLARVSEEHPPRARIHSLEHEWLDAVGFERFEIRRSDARGEKSAVLLPEIATCEACLSEVLDPGDRRHRYPFANCTHCGPRFTIIRSLPYDRANTTMSGFALCDACRAEYENPLDRRFHAQPIACPACGPKLALWDGSGTVMAEGDEALARTAAALRTGRVAAVKGIGGFHLMCDAAGAESVARLRAGKRRGEKPFAVMVGDLEQAAKLCEVGAEEARILASPEAPIVLLEKRAGAPVAFNVAPGYRTLGLMLPSTPLHHLLMREVGRPIVATSGNLADEPIATDEREALARLGGIADLWLVHDRPIERHVDDSVGCFLGGSFRLLRRARGFAPLPVRVARPWPTVVAVGAHLKSTIALAFGRQVFVSQHIGDLETPEAMGAFERLIADFIRLYEARPVAIAHDLHPDYLSTQWARRAGAMSEAAPRLIAVQHHHAHLAACLAEHGVEGRALGVTWDGTGWGIDGTVWGGEFLLGNAAAVERVAHLRAFRLPGGEAAIREPRRAALGLLWELLGEQALARGDLPAIASFSEEERAVLGRMMARGVNAPWTTSAGRLFDGVAALIGLHPRASHEGQAAVALEFEASPPERGTCALDVSPGGAPSSAGGRPPWIVDWRPMVNEVIADLARGTARGVIAARFHNTLVEAIVTVARKVGEPRVALTGGCFQNRLLTERALARLRASGHEVLVHQRVPPNDGGLSLGQAAVAAAEIMGE